MFFDRQQKLIAQNDTSELIANLFDFDNQPVSGDDVTSASFNIQRPDGTFDAPLEGEVDDDGTARGLYQGTAQLGHYIAVCTFGLANGESRSVRTDFEVFDPFNPPNPTEIDLVNEAVWSRLSDCFDAEEPGPWLQDMTLSFFNKDRMQDFINDAIFDINQQNPPTSEVLSTFFTGSADAAVPNPSNFTVLVEGVLIQVIRHLIRSYVEQPLPTGANVVYEDRRDYLLRWKDIYELELENYARWLALYKRQFLGLGRGKLIVASRAGRFIGAPMRSRFVGRGFWTILLLVLSGATLHNNYDTYRSNTGTISAYQAYVYRG